MADKMFENNQVTIVGKIVSDFQYSHEVYGEGFYMVKNLTSSLYKMMRISSTNPDNDSHMSRFIYPFAYQIDCTIRVCRIHILKTLNITLYELTYERDK